MLFLFALFGCNGYYRYPCQDPKNFNNEECVEPRCKFDGHCLEDIYGDKYEYVQKWVDMKNNVPKKEVE